ncbi:MAG TPA: protein kinase [Candidatus Avipropionibacterium avicola]|uniref:non-specific serine/threonine protein kinase n=1 Tax=Candidatus Avipropionibacterium avicola TaxID=2840701 RepID=A0A9D1KM82_9ACTN|nr:protein kinase [Candidatus Avipropionibacterium avicola]
MNGCGTPGCTGSIVDGYCDVCGSPGTGGTSSPGMVAQAQAAAPSTATPPPPPPGPGASVPPPGPRTAGSPASAIPLGAGPAGRLATPPPRPATSAGGQAIANGTPCSQPGCPGRIQTGYCDYCGAPAGSTAYTTPADDSADLSTRTRGSMTLQSMALGSRRAHGDGTSATRRESSMSRRVRTARLGVGLTTVPPAPQVDPAKALMSDPVVPEDKRNCPSCGAEVGRSRDGVPGRTEGFCPHCRNRYSFDPKLVPGELVAGQYEVAGCLAHGGLGWIYLARDKNVSDRWVVLKGLLNAGDADAMAAAIAEQQFLAQVEHPLIVEIYNFVTHDGAGYTVMEYVGGTSLKQLLKDRMEANSGLYDPLPVDQALAYVLEVLPAFQYLHDLGLLYCDFKPDNLIQVGDAVKLIDLGGVRRIDDHESAIYGTIGYQAPEVATLGPSIASDIYTLGRTLVVLVAEFRGYQSRWVDKLPGPDVLPVFAQYDSLYRLLMKCCAPDPADRFTSADELRLQLLGVLREVVASQTDGTSLTSASSVLFETPAITSSMLAWDQLPDLRADSTDPQFAWLANVSVEDPTERMEALDRAPARSPEVQLARARTALELERPDLVEHITNDMLAEDPWEWQAVWMTGLAALQHQDWVRAQLAFNAVYGQVPGELAPKLALAVACERGEEPDVAENLYGICASTDANYVAPAAFGMARIRKAKGDVDGAVEALDLVPTTSRAYAEARRLRAQVIMTRPNKGLETLAEALDTVAQVRLDNTERLRLTASVLEQALATVRKGGDKPKVSIGGHPATERGLRDGLEKTYRSLSRATRKGEDRVALVDKANEIRRWTLR